MTQLNCPASLQACAIRVARLATDGTTPAGATNAYITDKFARVTAKPVNQAGNDVTVLSACGGVAYNYRTRDTLKRLDVELEILNPDPELHELLVGASLITTGGNSIGATYPRTGVLPTGGISLEVWTRAILPSGTQDTTLPWFRWAFPATYWEMGDRQMDANPMSVVFTGFATENPGWGNGPWNDWPGGSLASVAGWFRDSALPTPACGYTAVPTQV